MRRTLIIAVTGGLSFGGWMASAQDVTGDIDTNGDGIYSLEELQAKHPDMTEETYAQVDADANGLVDEPEYQTALGTGLIMPPSN